MNEWVSEWVSGEWVSEWLSEWASEWVSEWVSEEAFMMSWFSIFGAPKSKTQLPSSRNNLEFASMIPNPQFLCALNPICSRFLKEHAPKIPTDPNFHAAVLPKFQQWHCNIFFESKGQHDCDWSGVKLAVWLWWLELYKNPRQHDSESLKYSTV